MIKLMRYAMVAAVVMAGAYAAPSKADVVISGTRLIYPAQEKEITAKLTNEGKSPVLAQVWLDDGDSQSTPDDAKVPFNVMPPIFRMDGGKGQAVRLAYTKEALPADKESLFWFNVLEIPPKAESKEGQSLLQFALRTRIKLFFRPVGLPGSAIDAPNKLSWKFASADGGQGVALVVTNPTAYYVNFSSIAVKSGDRSMESESVGGMVAPGATSSFKIKGLTTRPSGDAKVQFSAISDYGGFTSMEQPISS
jgi:chaperone protein EcpD